VGKNVKKCRSHFSNLVRSPISF